nr:hypothetical protein Itr_chr10CG16330 [Ipomoea trifida]
MAALAISIALLSEVTTTVHDIPDQGGCGDGGCAVLRWREEAAAVVVVATSSFSLRTAP